MNRMRTVRIIVCCLVGAILFSCENPKKETIRIMGSTTLEAFMKKAVAAYGKKTVFDIVAVGSRAGIDSLIAGACDIAMSSIEPLPEQSLAAKKKGITLKPFLIGYDVIIPIVHPSNAVSDITFGNLKNIFAGKIDSWLPLGGADTVIDIVDRAGSSGTYQFWHHTVTCSDTCDGHVSVEPTNSTVLAHISKNPNAIGYVSNVFVNPEVKPLKLDGIAIAESDSLISKYHLKRPLYLYVNAEKFENDLKSFIVFLIITDRGRELLREAGFFIDSYSSRPFIK